MYAWIWRHLPFGLPGKLAGSVLLTVASLALLWYVVFPWAEPFLPFDDAQLTDTGVPGAPAGEPGVPGELGVDGSEPALDDHELPYDTEQNNTPPPSPSR